MTVPCGRCADFSRRKPSITSVWRTRLYTESDSCRSLPLELAVKGNPDLEQFLKDNPGLAPDYATLDSKRRERWLEAAERALASLLSVSDILEKGSLVATMEARGYKVEVVAR